MIKKINNLSIDLKKIKNILEDSMKIDNEIEYKLTTDHLLTEYFSQETINVSVLGVDIYQYSHYEKNKQNLIPIIFRNIYLQTISNLLAREKILFKDYSEEIFEKQFIETGDGGFQILKDPLHSLFFSVYFHANLRAYNTGEYLKELHKFVGNLELRYCITKNDIFGFNNNYFGPAIIDNARIISSDSLNRFLIDDYTFQWFIKTLGGIETLVVLTRDELSSLLNIEQEINANSSLLFEDINNSKQTNNFKDVHVLKLEPISKKGKHFLVYSLYMQVYMHLRKESANKRKFIISIGNLNSSGI